MQTIQSKEQKIIGQLNNIVIFIKFSDQDEITRDFLSMIGNLIQKSGIFK